MVKHGKSRLNYDEQNQFSWLDLIKETVSREITELFGTHCFEYVNRVVIWTVTLT